MEVVDANISNDKKYKTYFILIYLRMRPYIFELYK